MSADFITPFFEKDHDEIDAILSSVEFDAPSAAERFAEFDRRLERHIGWEEDLLFPAVAAKAPPLEAGPIAVMKIEHVEIRARKAGAAEALAAGDPRGAKLEVAAMLRVLQGHNMKEEQILYPACDQLLDAAERRVVLDRVRNSADAASPGR